jgi:hypothetical protein
MYEFDSMRDLANFLRTRALQIDEYLMKLEKEHAPLRDRRNTWLDAALIVRDSVIKAPK